MTLKIGAVLIIAAAIFLLILLVGFFVYMYSGIQMRAWLNEFVKYFKELEENE